MDRHRRFRLGFLRRARLCVAVLPLMTAGCTAVDLGKITPAAVDLAGRCSGGELRAADATATPATLFVPSVAALKTGVVARSLDPSPVGRELGYDQVSSVKDMQAAVGTLKTQLPPRLQNDPVVNAFYAALTKAWVKGQVSGMRAARMANVDALDRQADQIKVPSRLTHGQIKHFATALLESYPGKTVTMAENGPLAFAASARPTMGDYLDAYYSGNYVDIYGTALPAPTITMTIDDTEIAGLLSVFLDYTLDSLRVTPVLGTGSAADSHTIYYPGNSAKEPTALALNNATYVQIPADSTSCAWTAKNAFLLATFANTAGDRAATLSGLVSQSAGGIEVGLGFLGKLSIGDNQTLSIIVKTAASRVANRAALAALYWSVARSH